MRPAILAKIDIFMTGIIFLFLGGLAAFGFLILLWQHRKMPILLRAILMIGAIAIVAYVAWILIASAPK